MPKVSVLMASYNHERYVEEAVNSVLGQSFKDFELIIVDDASRDSSLARLQNIKDPRIRLIEHPVNKGVSVTMNDAFAAAGGEYIALIASDDRWHAKKLRTQAEFLDSYPQFLAVFSTVRTIDGNGKALPDNEQIHFMREADRWKVLREFFNGRNILNAPSEMLRRSAIKDGEPFYDLRFLQLQDMEQHVRIALRGDIHVLPFHFVDYRWHGANLSGYSAKATLRSDIEHSLICDLLLTIEDPAIFKKIFDHISPHASAKELIPYILGIKALKSENFFQRYWGYKQIAGYFADSDRAEMLQKRVNFTTTDFYALAELLTRGS